MRCVRFVGERVVLCCVGSEASFPFSVLLALVIYTSGLVGWVVVVVVKKGIYPLGIGNCRCRALIVVSVVLVCWSAGLRI